jgi:heme exporter protein D
MIPDLGRYWLEVTASYVVGLGLLAVLVVLILRRNRAMRARLAEMEGRRAAAPAPQRDRADA